MYMMDMTHQSVTIINEAIGRAHSRLESGAHAAMCPIRGVNGSVLPTARASHRVAARRAGAAPSWQRAAAPCGTPLARFPCPDPESNAAVRWRQYASSALCSRMPAWPMPMSSARTAHDWWSWRRACHALGLHTLPYPRPYHASPIHSSHSTSHRAQE